MYFIRNEQILNNDVDRVLALISRVLWFIFNLIVFYSSVQNFLTFKENLKEPLPIRQLHVKMFLETSKIFPFVKTKIRLRYENSNDLAELIHSTSMLVNENRIKNNKHGIVHVRMYGSTWSEDTMERQVYAYSNVYRGMSGGARNPNVTYLVSYSQSGNTTELL